MLDVQDYLVHVFYMLFCTILLSTAWSSSSSDLRQNTAYPVPLKGDNSPLNSLPKRFKTVTLLKVSSMPFGLDSTEGTFPHLYFLDYLKNNLIVPPSPPSTPIPIFLASPFSTAECFTCLKYMKEKYVATGWSLLFKCKAARVSQLPVPKILFPWRIIYINI